MTTKKKAAGKGPKLTLKKETLKDLTAKGAAARGVKGGFTPKTPERTLGSCQVNSVCNSCYKSDCCLAEP